MTGEPSDPGAADRLVDQTAVTLDPRHVAHFLAACAVAGVPVVRTGPTELRALIEQLSRLSIPDAVKLLRAEPRP